MEAKRIRETIQHHSAVVIYTPFVFIGGIWIYKFSTVPVHNTEITKRKLLFSFLMKQIVLNCNISQLCCVGL